MQFSIRWISLEVLNVISGVRIAATTVTHKTKVMERGTAKGKDTRIPGECWGFVCATDPSRYCSQKKSPVNVTKDGKQTFNLRDQHCRGFVPVWNWTEKREASKTSLFSSFINKLLFSYKQLSLNPTVSFCPLPFRLCSWSAALNVWSYLTT